MNGRIADAAGATITGRVLLDGEPVPYFGVRTIGERENPYLGTATEVHATDGRFELYDVPRGPRRVAVKAPGTRMAISREVVLAGDDVGAVDVGDVELARGDRLAGHVRDAAGAPVADARVRVGRRWPLAARHVRGAIQRLFTPVYETTTDAGGAYAFDGIDLDRHVVAELAWATHGRAGASLIHVVPRADAKLDFVLLGAGRIEGTVEDLQERHASVLVQRADEPPDARRASCDHQGHFELFDVPPGPYMVRIDAPDAEPKPILVLDQQVMVATLIMPSTSVTLHLQVPVGAMHDVAIEPAGEGAAILGRVRGFMGMGTYGRCMFQHVRPGSYRVSLDGSRWTTITVEPSPGVQTIDLRELSHHRG